MSLLTPELREFLTSTARIAKVSVRRKNGLPWVQPVWFDVDEDQLIFVVAVPSLLGYALKRGEGMAVCVDDIEAPFGFATLEGKVETFPDSPDAVVWQERMIRRYRDDVPDPAAHARMLADMYGGMLTRFTPTAVHFESAGGLFMQAERS
ncbi:pyridoxamine 5'-phosphate oxidase family protein [Streptomyces sp. NPDC096311]|uniref:pyridoxamine 5'-phosphate oxidase family protein n=1 Tax=Streptomyces sp. NPDC096311 TaxID=3366083 RepID=UPI0038244930